MTDLTQLFAIATALAGLLASISIWAPRQLLVKVSALGTAALFLPLAYASQVSLLSHPKPAGLEWWRSAAPEATVLGSRAEEGHGIYLWLQLQGTLEPRAYVLPWDQAMAEQLQKALREAEQNQSGVKMRLPFEPSLDDREPRFYAMPQPAMPEKEAPPTGPQFYQAPGRDA